MARFANFNELFTNAVGDSILKKVCEELLSVFDKQVYRISGDVFAMIRYHESECNSQIKNQIEYIFKHNIIIDSKHYHIDFNMGICSYPQYGTEGTVLLERTLLALSHVKSKKHENIAIFNNAILEKIHHDEQFTSAEALLRVKNFDGSYINPEEIIDSFSIPHHLIGMEVTEGILI